MGEKKNKSYIQGQFSGSVSSLKPITLLCLHCLRTLPWDAHAHPHHDGSWSEGFWEEQDLLWPGIILWLLTQKSLSGHVSCLLYQTGFFPFFVLAIITPLEVFNKRPRLAIYLFLLAVTSSTGAHLPLVSGNAKRRLVYCKFPTWSPSISSLTGNWQGPVQMQQDLLATGQAWPQRLGGRLCPGTTCHSPRRRTFHSRFACKQCSSDRH